MFLQEYDENEYEDEEEDEYVDYDDEDEEGHFPLQALGERLLRTSRPGSWSAGIGMLVLHGNTLQVCRPPYARRCEDDHLCNQGSKA